MRIQDKLWAILLILVILVGCCFVGFIAGVLYIKFALLRGALLI